jgi:hypothetical protein
MSAPMPVSTLWHGWLLVLEDLHAAATRTRPVNVRIGRPRTVP